ncbi:hypothetical protein Vi05172_g8238 [Venturia inaequalis]|nr:hypothetical protein Vi05172_g8238 [Venturia inaequalis]
MSHRHLRAAHAAEQMRADSQKDLRVSHAHTGLLMAGDARAITRKKREDTLAEQRAKLDAKQLKADNKARKKQERLEIDTRRELRAANKAAGIKTPRFRKNVVE